MYEKTKNDKDHESVLNEFKISNSPRGVRSSKLAPFIELIENLHNDRYSLEQISDFMKLVGVDVHYTTISRFIKKNCHLEDKVVQRRTDINTQLVMSEKSKSGLNLSRPEQPGLKYSPKSTED